MSDFTYSTENRNEKLEKYEWDNVWWDCADDLNTDRVLYVGDSISCGVRRTATELANNSLLFDGIGTSKALDNPYFMDLVRLFTKQQGARRVICFNNGLHGWHLSDDEEYGKYYESLLKAILNEFKNTPVLLVLTTSVLNEERESRVITRNNVVKEIAKKYNLPTVDYYSLTKGREELFTEDGVHLTQEGYTLLADCLLNSVKAILGEK